jgi:predicted proteasome-type protease
LTGNECDLLGFLILLILLLIFIIIRLLRVDLVFSMSILSKYYMSLDHRFESDFGIGVPMATSRTFGHSLKFVKKRRAVAINYRNQTYQSIRTQTTSSVRYVYVLDVPKTRGKR